MAKKHGKGKNIPYTDGVVCIVTIDGTQSGGASIFTAQTQVTGCELQDNNDNFVANWDITKQTVHDGKITIVFTARDPRIAAAKKRGDKTTTTGTGQIVVTTATPVSTTNPGIPVEPVDIDPCGR